MNLGGGANKKRSPRGARPDIIHLRKTNHNVNSHFRQPFATGFSQQFAKGENKRFLYKVEQQNWLAACEIYSMNGIHKIVHGYKLNSQSKAINPLIASHLGSERHSFTSKGQRCCYSCLFVQFLTASSLSFQ